MTMESLPGEILFISPQAQRVLTRAAAKRKSARKAKPSSVNRGRGDLAYQMFRTHARMTLLAGGNPNHFSPELIQSLCAADPQVDEAVSRWIVRHARR